MGYERNDRRYYSGGQDRPYGDNRERGYGQRYGGDRYGRDEYRGNDYRGERDRYGAQAGYRSGHDDRDDHERRRRSYDEQDRGFFERAGDEVRSWFGDDDAERRRREDDRRAGYGSDRGYSSYGAGAASEYGLADPYAYGGDGGYGYRDRDDRYASDEGRRRDRFAQHDHGYRSWRDRQMSQFDRDYDEYRREHQSKFDSDFAAWRQNRQSQRELLGKVQEHQEVVGSDGQHVGIVDHVRGDHIRLTKSDSDAGGHHHSIPCSWIQSIEDKVTLSKTADQVKQHWRDEDREDGGLFRRDHNLNRSFSGTY